MRPIEMYCMCGLRTLLPESQTIVATSVRIDQLLQLRYRSKHRPIIWVQKFWFDECSRCRKIVWCLGEKRTFICDSEGRICHQLHSDIPGIWEM